MDKRGGEYQDFQSEIFCLTVPKNSVGESFGVEIFLGVEKVWIREEGEYQGFQSKIFCLTVPKIFVGEPFSVSLIAGTEEVCIGGGGGASKFSVEFFLSHSAENLNTEESFSVSLISGIKKLYASEGYVTIF